ncbi:hypothetical protein SAMN04490198_3340 [Pseudomonas palleroniana]|uniref:Uncharacterized protein n=1 Tax=Pseudomonas palleroniana TaxID=191390 RepID=A0A1H5MHT3_9PSED|nr:hypothetical protein SAMN04490198_3340 [Pseudomonas palleroniana]
MLWRGSLLPYDSAAGARFQGRFAPQRKQACSPQQASAYRQVSEPTKSRNARTLAAGKCRDG